MLQVFQSATFTTLHSALIVLLISACNTNGSPSGEVATASLPRGTSAEVGGSSPREAVEQFMNAYKSGDVDLLMKLAPNEMVDSLGETKARKVFQDTVEELRKRDGGIVDVVITDEEASGDTVKVSYRTVFKSDSDQSTCIVEKRDGRWRVTKF